MKLAQIRYMLAVVAREIPADMDEQTCEDATVRLISRVRRAMERNARRRVNRLRGELAAAERAADRYTYYHQAVHCTAVLRRAADRAAAEHRGELARRAAERAADRAELARWAGELAKLAAAGEGRADRAADRAGMRVALTRPAAGELAPVSVMRAADAADRASSAARAAGELARRFRFAVRA